MDNVFNNLILRPNAQVETNLGNPWEIIPIRNRKNAKECTEIHLAGRNIDGLCGFEDFPNLEVLWINNNKIEKIENLETNFRIKQLYAHNNKIKTLEGSISSLPYLETLSISNNELRNLDKNIEFLKEYTLLTHLDLFGNPLAEEPNYRYKIVHFLPQIKIFDRHVINLDERRKAALIIQKLNTKKVIKNPKKIAADKKSSMKRKVGMMSLAENALFHEAKDITIKHLEKTQKEEENLNNTLKRFQVDYGDTIPKATVVWEVSEDFVDDPIKFVSEWEKDSLKKIFKKYDKDKSATVLIENFPQMFEDLANDLSLIGKSPDCTYEEFLECMTSNEKEKTNRVTWEIFRIRLNKFKWRKANEVLLKQRIDEKYYEANKLKMTGKKNEAFNILFQAIKLETVANMDEIEKKAFKYVEKVKDPMRYDYVNFSSFKFRNKLPILKGDEKHLI